MYKFRAVFSQSGRFTFNDNQYNFSESFFETSNKELADFLRKNNNFQEIKEEKEDIEELREKAIEMGLEPHHAAGKKKLLEMIEAVEKVVDKNIPCETEKIEGE